MCFLYVNEEKAERNKEQREVWMQQPTSERTIPGKEEKVQIINTEK